MAAARASAAGSALCGPLRVASRAPRVIRSNFVAQLALRRGSAPLLAQRGELGLPAARCRLGHEAAGCCSVRWAHTEISASPKGRGAEAGGAGSRGPAAGAKRRRGVRPAPGRRWDPEVAVARAEGDSTGAKISAVMAGCVERHDVPAIVELFEWVHASGRHVPPSFVESVVASMAQSAPPAKVRELWHGLKSAPWMEEAAPDVLPALLEEARRTDSPQLFLFFLDALVEEGGAPAPPLILGALEDAARSRRRPMVQRLLQVARATRPVSTESAMTAVLRGFAEAGDAAGAAAAMRVLDKAGAGREAAREGRDLFLLALARDGSDPARVRSELEQAQQQRRGGTGAAPAPGVLLECVAAMARAGDAIAARTTLEEASSDAVALPPVTEATVQAWVAVVEGCGRSLGSLALEAASATLDSDSGAPVAAEDVAAAWEVRARATLAATGAAAGSEVVQEMQRRDVPVSAALIARLEEAVEGARRDAAREAERAQQRAAAEEEAAAARERAKERHRAREAAREQGEAARRRQEQQSTKGEGKGEGKGEKERKKRAGPSPTTGNATDEALQRLVGEVDSIVRRALERDAGGGAGQGRVIARRPTATAGGAGAASRWQVLRSWDALARGYASRGDASGAEGVVREVEGRGLRPLASSVAAVVEAYGRSGDREGAVRVLDEYMGGERSREAQATLWGGWARARVALGEEEELVREWRELRGSDAGLSAAAAPHVAEALLGADRIEEAHEVLRESKKE